MDNSFQDNRYLTSELLKGNEKAYKYLYDNAYSEIVHYVCNMTKNYDQAEDIVQGIIVKLWNNRENTIINTSIKSYLYKAAYNSFINEYKKDKLKESLADQIKHAVIIEMLDNDDETIERKIKEINIIVDQMPTKRKEIFVLNKKEGLTYDEIASYLEISSKTVENQIGRAIYEIRTQLKNNKNNGITIVISLMILNS